MMVHEYQDVNRAINLPCISGNEHYWAEVIVIIFILYIYNESEVLY